jgi:hypothetical protein
MATANKDSNYKMLAAIGVSDKIENKGGRDYLSWAWAWHLLKMQYPDANRTVYEDPTTGLNYFSDGRYAYVKVGITVDGVEHIDYLPVMDHRFKAIPIEGVTSFDVNKTIQRSTTKAIAMHGLGLSLWIGEDTSMMGAEKQEEAPSKKTSREVAKKSDDKIVLEVDSENWSKVLKYIAANKELGLRKIGQNLTSKYKLTTPVKQSLKEAFDKISKEE